jgi:hypothetical protein
MLLMRIVACVLPGFLLVPTLAAGQQTPKQPASRIVEGTDIRGGVAPWRTVRTASRTGDRDTVTESEQAAGTDGRLVPVRETQAEIMRAGSVVRTSAETSGFGISGQRYPLETRDSIEDGSASGRVLRTDTTQRLDINGRLAISERSTEESSVTPEGRRSERTIRRPDLDRRLRAQERTEHTERRVAPQAVRTTTTELGTDLDARWQVLEVRDREERTTGSISETAETVRRPDLNGRLSERERRISRSTVGNGREDLLVETFMDDGGRYVSRPTIRHTLTQRLRRTTTPGADGGRQVVEEVEERSLVASEEPLRLVRRIVTTVRPTGTGRWRTERQAFDRDLNGRLIPTVLEIEESTEP